MSKQWLNVRESDGRVIGTQRTGADNLPTKPEGVRQVERTDEEMVAFFDLEAAARSEKRAADITESDGACTLAPDTRPYLDITVDNTEPVVDVDTATFTIKKLNADDSIDTDFNQPVKFPFNNRLFKVTFVNGVATKGLVFKKSRTRIISSTPNFKLKTPLTIDVVE